MSKPDVQHAASGFSVECRTRFPLALRSNPVYQARFLWHGGGPVRSVASYVARGAGGAAAALS